MDGGQVLVAVLIAMLLGMNIVASIKVQVSKFYEPSQKAIQHLLIWLVPIVGAILCYGLARQSDGPHSGKYAEDISLYDDGNVGIENADADYFGGGTHHGDQLDF
jgi:hypothetical protein